MAICHLAMVLEEGLLEAVVDPVSLLRVRPRLNFAVDLSRPVPTARHSKPNVCLAVLLDKHPHVSSLAQLLQCASSRSQPLEHLKEMLRYRSSLVRRSLISTTTL